MARNVKSTIATSPESSLCVDHVYGCNTCPTFSRTVLSRVGNDFRVDAISIEHDESRLMPNRSRVLT